MAEDINRVNLNGRLTRDGEISYTTGGTAVLKMSMAVNARRKKGDGWEDYGNFFDLEMWGKRAESVAQYLTKGKQVSIDGKLEQQRWQASDGSKRSKVVIKVDSLQFIGGKQDGQSRGENWEQPKQGNSPSLDSEIPF